MLDDSDIRLKETRVFYMQMNERPMRQCDPDPSIEFLELTKPIDCQYYMELYQGVGLSCNWVDRLVISESDLSTLINRESVRIYMILHEDDPCGFLELEERSGYVEFLYFGLLQDYIGQGLGSKCLKMAVDVAWDLDPVWLQVNISELDSEHAYGLYEKAGFEHYTTRLEMRQALR